MIDPWLFDSPDCSSEGVSPSQENSGRGERKRRQSPPSSRCSAQLRRLLLEALAPEPEAVTLVPSRRLRIDAAVLEQQLRDPMAGAQQIAAKLLPRSHQVAGGLDELARNRDRAQLPCEREPGQQLGVLAIGLDPLAGRPGGLAGSDHLDRDALLAGGAEEGEAGRPGLIDRPNGLRQLRATSPPPVRCPVRTAPAAARPC